MVGPGRFELLRVLLQAVDLELRAIEAETAAAQRTAQAGDKLDQEPPGETSTAVRCEATPSKGEKSQEEATAPPPRQLEPRKGQGGGPP